MSHITINHRRIGPGEPVYIIAEMSANHGQDKERAKKIIHAMKESGADAVKLQTYTAGTMTIDCDRTYFVDCLKGTIWEGQSLYALYGEAYMPWEWQPELKEEAESLGMDCFSTAVDDTSVTFLEEMGMPAFKISSFELVHLPLLRRAARTGKPIILSTGMATREEIWEAVNAAREAGVVGIALLKCTSTYPATIEDANVRTISAMTKEFDVPVGLSDHTPGSTVPIASVTQGACIIEKHFILDRGRDKGPDSAFSMEPQEFRAMVDAVRATEKDLSGVKVEEKALGGVHYGPAGREKGSMVFRPSLFVVENVKEGDIFTEKNLRIIRPGYGLKPKYYESVLGKKATRSIERGTPLTWEIVQKQEALAHSPA